MRSFARGASARLLFFSANGWFFGVFGVPAGAGVAALSGAATPAAALAAVAAPAPAPAAAPSPAAARSVKKVKVINLFNYLLKKSGQFKMQLVTLISILQTKTAEKPSKAQLSI